MKETISVNIGQQAFTMDIDAHRKLTAYIKDITLRLANEDNEVISDIESRIAEIFREKVPSPMMVITMSIVESTIQQIGSPDTFGTDPHQSQEGSNDQYTQEANGPRKLYRSRKSRAIGGVCAGIAEYLDTDITIIRVVAILLLFFAGGSLWLYIILWIMVPEEPKQQTLFNNKC